MSVASVHFLGSDPTAKSIQGERQEEARQLTWMDMAEVDQYVTKASPEVLECRERGRHVYPSIRETFRFSGVTKEGLMIRRVTCKVCHLVGREEEWDVRHHRGKVTNCELVSARPDYSPRGPHGEKYLGPSGHGRMTNKMVRNTIGTQALHDQSFKELRRAALEAQQTLDLKT